MTLRDHFAGLAMQAILTNALAGNEELGMVPELAYDIANSMIDESEKWRQAEELNPDTKIGEYWPEQGGLYFGRIEEDGKLYALIVARKEDGENIEVNWSEANEFCRNLKIGEFDNWVMPNRYDLLVMFMNNSGNVGEFIEHWYWSSTEFNANYVWTQDFTNGTQFNNGKTATYSVRAVRKVLI